MKVPILKASLAPDTVSAQELPFLWRQSIAPFFDARPVTPSRHLEHLPDMHQYYLEKVLFGDIRFSGHTFTRDAYWLQQHDDSDHLLLQLFVDGENSVVNGKCEYIEKPGNIYAVNLAHQVRTLSTDSRVLNLVLPRDLVRDEIPQLTDACGALFAPDSASARIFVDYMLSMGSNLSQATAEEIPAIVTGTLGLLDSLTLHNDIGSSAALHAAFRTACRYIDRHLDNPTLGVDSICKHLRCSRATLYRLFEPHGGVRRHILRRRLIACFKAISSRQSRHRGIFEIALDFGFVSPSHFSHLFRSHFGLTPREVRDASFHIAPRTEPIAMPEGSGSDEVERMWRWAKTLTRQAKV